MYPVKLYREISTWRKVRKIAIENREVLAEKGFRVDWIGRIYTVMNLPEEVANHNPQVQQAWMLSQFREFDSIFLEMGIADYIYPEFSPINDAAAYLLVLSPDRDYLKFWPALIFLFKVTGVLVGLKILYNLVIKFKEPITEFWNSFFDLIF